MNGEVPQFKEFDFTVVPSDTVVKGGRKAELPCTATYDSGAPSVYSWTRNGEILHIWSGMNK